MEQLPTESFVDWQKRINEESKSSDEESEIMFRVHPVVVNDSQSQDIDVEADDEQDRYYNPNGVPKHLEFDPKNKSV